MAADEKIIIVKAGIDEFAISVDFVLSIESGHMCTDIAEIRGESIDIVRLDKLMKSPKTDGVKDGKIVVVECSGKKAGLYVDETSSVTALLEPVYSLPPELGINSGGLISGAVQLEDKLVIMLDIPGVVSEIDEMRTA